MTGSPFAPGHLTIDRDHISSWVPRLKELYECEAARLSGSGSSHSDIRGVLWTRDEIVTTLGLSPKESEDMNSLIDYMVSERQILRIPPTGQAPEKFISRVGETVRLLGHTYEYWMMGRPGINAIRWLVEEKLVPERNIPPSEMIRRLEVDAARIPDVATRAPNLVTAVQRVIGKVANIMGGEAKARFSHFQYEGVRAFLLSQFLPAEGRPGASIITAGVGSGKTLGFALGALIASVEGSLSGGKAPRTYLLVYPRKALAIDQYKTIRRYVEAVEPAATLHLEHESSYEPPVWRKIQDKYSESRPPNLIVTTFETLKRRIQHPLFCRALSSHLAGIIVDEIHLAEGLAGGHIAMLMRRLRALASDRNLVLMGASGTVARPDEHAASIFGLSYKDVEVVSPLEGSASAVGIAHHVFLRPSGLGSPQGALVNATSLLVHSRREDVGERGKSEKKRQKTIAFADNLDLLGRWNADLRENERTEGHGERTHPRDPNPRGWNERQREVPYALRFERPLVRRLRAVGGAPEGFALALPRLTSEQRDADWCTKCQAGLKETIIENVTPEEMRALGAVVQRYEFDPAHSMKIFHLDNPVFEKGATRIGTLDDCPYLQAGACLWFPRGSPGPMLSGGTQYPPPFAIEPVPESSPEIYEWRNVARSAIYSSKSSQGAENAGDDLSDVVYKAPAALVYGTRSKQSLQVDVVLASPSLEVGMDLETLTESMMTKAMRSVASYRQKAGRVGREPGLDVLNVTLVHETPLDLHYYRQPGKLVSRGRLDPIPLKDRNDAILYCGLFNAIWDWLARKQVLPEPVPSEIGTDGTTGFTAKLKECERALTDPASRSELVGHLRLVAHGLRDVSSAEIDDAIEQALREIRILLRPADGTFVVRPPATRPTLADILVYLDANLVRHTRDVRPALGSDLEGFYELIEEFRRARLKVSVGLDGDFPEWRELLAMDRTGNWTADNVRAAIAALHTLNGMPGRGIESTRDLETRLLPKLLTALEDVVAKGHDPLVYAIYESYSKLLRTPEAWHRRYFIDVMRDLPGIEAGRKERWFVRPDNLFSNPFEPEVSLVRSSGEEREKVGIGEALASYLPGVWTFRYPEACYKIKCGPLELARGGRLVAQLTEIQNEGAEVERIKQKLPPPPGIFGSVDVYRPKRLTLKQENLKYLRLDRTRGLILDGDEVHGGGAAGGPPAHVKIPKSYLNRWTHVSPRSREPVLALAPDEGRLFVEATSGEVDGDEARHIIRHPLFDSHFSSVYWHAPLEVTEYVYSVSRSYTGGSGEGVILTYQDRFGVDISFGDTFTTEGLSFELAPQGVEGLLSIVVGGISGGLPVWQPSLLKVMKAHLAELIGPEGAPLIGNQFLLDDLVGLVLPYALEVRLALRPQDLLDAIQKAARDPELPKRAREYYRRKASPHALEDEDFGGQLPVTDDSFILGRAQVLTEVVIGVSGAIWAVPDPLVSFRNFLPDWVRRTLLNTLGIVATTALQQYSGATEKDVGYAIDPGAWNHSPNGDPPWRIYLYDRARFGNGSCNVGRRYFHIPHLLRHGLNPTSRLLPTEDFLSRLEEGLLQCTQFHTDLSALELQRTMTPGPATPIQGLADIEDAASEVQQVASDIWRRIGVSHPSDGWQLPVAAAHLDSLASTSGIERDDLLRATHICWTGCPECVDRGDLLAGGPMARNYVDKFVLDTWFMEGVKRSHEYAVLDLGRLGGGLGLPDFGALHQVGIDLPSVSGGSRRRLRSSCLPWTIGLTLDRGEDPATARVVMRVSDILGHRLPAPPTPGIASGIESVGFKRLMWFDLVVTAYLDAFGLLAGRDRTVELVYYDCRDVDFTDVGLSPRMLESVLALARKSGVVTDFDRLSDILTWLAFRGFQIRVCVDSTQGKEAGVVSFLTRLQRSGHSQVSIVQKTVPGGHMHKKVLITPIAILKGSANLSGAGTRESEELIDHFFLGTGAYAGALKNTRDSFAGADPWT
jgi:hypothetical protein